MTDWCMNLYIFSQITLHPNIQLLSNWQHAYQAFLSYFLVLYGHAGWTLEKNIYINMIYNYSTTIYESIFAQMYTFLLKYFQIL